MRRKKLLTWLIIIACVLLIGLAIIGWLLYSFFKPFFAYRLPETPAELRTPRIVVGPEFLSKKQFLTTGGSFDASTGIGEIEDIAIGELDSHSGLDIVIAGRYGAMIVDRNGAKQSQVQYEFEIEREKVAGFDAQSPETMLGDVQVIDIERDGTCEYLARGGIDGAAVFDHQGKRLWSYGKFTEEKTSIDDLAVGDINGDGISEFIAAWNGLELFDRHGSKGWTQAWERSVHQVEVVDVDGDRKNEIIHSSGTGLVIRDGQGEIVKEVEMPFYFSQFHLCAMPGKEERLHFLAFAEDNVWLIDFEGNVVNKFAAPLSRFKNARKVSNDDPYDIGSGDTSVYKAKGVWVKLKEAQPSFLAVVTEFAAIDRSVLYIYSSEGRLVYQEVLPEQSKSIAVLSLEEGRDAQELLVGGSETVWRYSGR